MSTPTRRAGMRHLWQVRSGHIQVLSLPHSGCFGDRVSELDLAPRGTPRLGGAAVLVKSRAAGGERVLGLQ